MRLTVKGTMAGTWGKKLILHIWQESLMLQGILPVRQLSLVCAVSSHICQLKYQFAEACANSSRIPLSLIKIYVQKESCFSWRFLSWRAQLVHTLTKISVADL